MRKILLILILSGIIISLFGCYGLENREEGEWTIIEEVKFLEIKQCGIKFDQIEFDVDFNGIDLFTETKPIQTKQEALMVGKTIIKECHEKNMFNDYTLLSIVYSTQDNIWCFDYSIDQRYTNVEDLLDCGNLYVAVSGADGKLIKAWAED